MKYVIELLQRELTFETECRSDAVEHLTPSGTRAMPLEHAQTRDAFLESLRLAEERVPQLVKAIEILKRADTHALHAVQKGSSEGFREL